MGDASGRRDVAVSDLGLEGRRALRDGAPDPAVAEDADGLASQARAQRRVALRPGPRADIRIALGYLVQERQDQRQRHIRDVAGQNIRRIGDADAAGAGAREINRVDADAVAGNDLERRQCVDQRGVGAQFAACRDGANAGGRLGEEGLAIRDLLQSAHRIFAFHRLEVPGGIGADQQDLWF